MPPPARVDLHRFVGRHDELDELVRSLDTVRAGAVPVVAALSGEPGIGKTRLLHEFIGRACTAGFRLALGRGSELEQEIPFGVIVDALEEPLSPLVPTIRPDLPAEFLAELATVFPSFRTLLGGQEPGSIGTERYRFHRAVRALLRRASQDTPILLALDDVHWADPASVEVVAHLLRRQPPHVLVVITYRTQQAPKQLRAAFAQVAREGNLRSIPLGPLSVTDAATLLDTNKGSVTFQQLYAESGGNPFYLEQLARSAARRTEEAPTLATDPWWQFLSIPRAVALAVEQEIEGLSDTARQVLRACSVVGEPFDMELVAAVAQLQDEAVYGDAVEELVTTELIRPSTRDFGRLLFRHPVVRRAVYENAGFAWRRLAHRRAVDVLATRGAGMEALAHHIERSAVMGDHRAIEILTTAGRAAIGRAPAAAATWLATALRLMPDGADPEQRVNLLVQLASVYSTIGRLHDMLDVLQQALELIPATDSGTRGRVMTMMAGAHQVLGRGGEARRLLQIALDQTTSNSADAVALMLELAKNEFIMRQWSDAVGTAARARSLALELKRPELVVAATARLAQYSVHHADGIGDQESRLPALLDDAVAQLDAIDDTISPHVLDALADLVYTETLFERWDAAELHGQRVLDLCRSVGNGALFVEVEMRLTIIWMLQGQVERARRAIERSLETAELLGNDHLLASTLAVKCWIRSVRGDTQEALTAGARAIEVAARTPRSFNPWLAHICYGEALIESGHVHEGHARILIAGGPELNDVAPSSRPRWHRVLTQAELAMGNLRAADEMAARAEAGGLALGTAMRTGDGRLARAQVLMALRQFTEAAALAREAASSYDQCGARIDAAQAHLVAGTALLRADAMDEAKHELEVAHKTFDDCGAARYADRAARELRNLGRRPHGAPRPRLRDRSIELTGREAEVVNRVAMGYTNRQIATELCVSIKTVEAQLTRLYHRLGVSSRAQLAALSVMRQ